MCADVTLSDRNLSVTSAYIYISSSVRATSAGKRLLKKEQSAVPS